MKKVRMLPSGLLRLTAAEESPAAAAEEIHQITQAQIGAGIAAKGESLEITCLLTVS